MIRTKFRGLMAVGALLLLGVGLSGCGQTVETGNVGVFIKQYGGDAGVNPAPVSQGWHQTGIGEHIIQYPVIEKAYPYTREESAGQGGSAGNEEVSFSDHTGLPMTADVQVRLAVNPALAPKLYKTWKLSFPELLSGPIRNDIRSAIAAETELVPVDQLYSGGRQAVIGRALSRVQKKWAPEGVNISALDWLGSIRYPNSVTEGITNKSKIEQETLVAQGLVAKAKAEADAKIEKARGEAESTRLQAEALRANPEILRQKEIEAWKGLCPLNVKTCIISDKAMSMVTDQGN